jgi:hypothetical protein
LKYEITWIASWIALSLQPWARRLSASSRPTFAGDAVSLIA